MNMTKLNIAVIALLKPSQVEYKLHPLSNSIFVNKIYLFRKRDLLKTFDKLLFFKLPPVFNFKPFYWFLTPFYIAFKLRDKDIDVLLSYRFTPHTIYTYIVSLLLNKPFIYSQIDQDIVAWNEHKFLGFFVKHILKRASFINVPGINSQLYWTEKGFSQKISVLHSTVDTNIFRNLYIHKKFDLIYVGVLTKLKQVDVILKAINMLNSLNFKCNIAIIGNGPTFTDLHQYCEENGLLSQVFFLGQQTEVLQFLNESKVFIMASQSEGLPCSLLEAMACELIPIIPNVGDIDEAIINCETGFFYDTNEIQQLSELIQYVLQNYDNLIDLRIAARNMIIDKHSFVSATAKWDHLLGEFIHE